MPVNILIIDDSSVMRKIVDRSLRKTQLQIGEVIEAGDGAEALAKLNGEPKVQLVFSDVNMPNMDGLEFLKNVKGSAHKQIPVIMITTEGTESKVMQALQLGAAGYVRKPFTQVQMEEVLGRLQL